MPRFLNRGMNGAPALSSIIAKRIPSRSSLAASPSSLIFLPEDLVAKPSPTFFSPSMYPSLLHPGLYFKQHSDPLQK